MKQLSLVLIFVLFFSLTACAPKATGIQLPTDGSPFTPPESVTDPLPAQSAPPAGTLPLVTEPTEPMEPAHPEVPALAGPREPEQAVLYPFSEEELASAWDTALDYLLRQQNSPHPQYRISRLVYDPLTTDLQVQQELARNPGSSEEMLYARRITLTADYTAVYPRVPNSSRDEDALVEQGSLSIALTRKTPYSPWVFGEIGPAGALSQCILTSQQTESLYFEGERLLSAYRTEEDEYWFFLQDPASGEQRRMVCQEADLFYLQKHSSSLAVWDESTWQLGPPISPEPGDTGATWDPSKAANYPADGDCTEMELLEKWMDVEGLTMEELDQRNCNQLLLTVARATDGVQTYNLCYERTDGGQWAPVQGLTWMHGWVGSRGIMHNRKIDTYTSPAGLWSLGLAFGLRSRPYGLKMPWRNVTAQSDWVTEPESKYFNTWQERDDPELDETWHRGSHDIEHLANFRGAYDYACVIRFNMAPYADNTRGCAIFLHCSTGATAGCVGLPEEDMVRTLLWLDPEQNPYILITGNE